ncbi:MAG TPA: LamG domain-containing protein, partial [Planctomycetota bacterium]|nr:LamG domain-containing protein [Planctomycetota bacterium]
MKNEPRTTKNDGEAGWRGAQRAMSDDRDKSQTLTHALISIVILFITALMVYAIIFTWELDPSTQGGYSVNGPANSIRVISPTGIAELIQQPAKTFIHDDNSTSAPQGYEQSGYSAINLDAFNSDGAYVRLARQPNGGYYPTGDFTSRVIDNTTSQTWDGLEWTDCRAEVLAGESNLSALWHMNEALWNGTANEVVDASGLANHGARAAGTGSTVLSPAVFSRAGNFPGNTYINRADAVSLQFGTGNFSIEAWVNLSSIGLNQTIIHKRNDDGVNFDNNRGWELWINSSNQPTFSVLWVDDIALPTEVNNTDISAGKSLEANKWYHIAVTRNVDTIAIYVNSQLVGSGTIDPAIDVSAGTYALEIGRRGTPASQYFNGRLDDVVLYKGRMLTESQIRKHYVDGTGLKFQVRAAGINTDPPSVIESAGWSVSYTSAAMPSVVSGLGVTGRYFQYKAFFEKPENADATPGLKAVTATPGTYIDSVQANFDAGSYSQTVWNTDYIKLLTTYDGTTPRTGNEDNIIALWRMDDSIADSKIDDTATNGANSDAAWLGKGVAAAKPTQEASKAGFTNCLRFDGVDDYLYVTHTNDTLLKKELGLEAWVKFDANFTAGAPVQMSIIKKKDSYELRFNKTTGKLDFVLYDNTPPPPTWSFMSGLDALTDPYNLYWIVGQPMAVYKDRLYAGVSGDAANTPDPYLFYYDGTVWAEDTAFYTKSNATYEGIYSTCVYDFNGDGTDDLLVGMGLTADDADLFIQDGATGIWRKDNDADMLAWGMGAGRGLEEKVTAGYAYTAITAMYDLNGELFLGFTSATGGQGDIWVYNPTSGWRKDADALRGAGKGFDEKTNATYHQSVESFCLFEGKLYAGIGGGIAAGVDGYANVVAFDPVSQSWSDRVLVSGNVRTVHSLAVYAGKLYAGTGSGYPYNASGSAGDGDVYASTDGAAWAVSYASPGYPYDIQGLAVFNGKLYAVGGRKRSFTTDYNYARVVEFDGSIWKPTYNTGTEIGALGLTNGGQYGMASSLFVASGFDDALYMGCGMMIDDGDLFRYGSAPYTFATNKNSWTNGVWYHISAGFDGTTIKLEIAQDGVGVIEETAYNQTFIVKPTTNPVLIGQKFDGVLDDVAIYKQNHVGYRTSGSYTATAIAPTLVGAIAQWDKIKWAEDEYYCDELVPASDLVGLWHMNEALWNGTSNEVIDGSGDGNHGTAKMGAATNSTFYRFGGYSGFFDGVDNYVAIGDSDSFSWTDKATVDAWIKTGDVLQQSVIAKGDGVNQNEFYLGIGADGIPFGWVSSNGIDKSTFAYGPFSVNNNKWNHIALVYDGIRIIVYSNGEAGSAVSFSGNVANRSDSVWIGSDAETLWAFNGYIDEVAIHDRALSAAEVLGHYKHGALGLKFQVRSGDTNPPGGSFVGPDGTVNTYYEDSTAATETITRCNYGVAGFPTNYISNVGKYIQYKAVFSLETMKYTPRLESVSVSHLPYYSADNPWVMNSVSQTYTTPIAAVSQVVTNNSWGAATTGSVRYQFSPNDGTNWYYYNGSWVDLGGAPTYASGTNLLGNLNRTIWATFPLPLPGPRGEFRWRAYLVSDGIQPVALDSLYFTDIYFEVTNPAGGESLIAGGLYDVKWDYSGAAGSQVKLEYCTNWNGSAGTWNPVTTTGGGWLPIIDKAVSWTVTTTASANCRIRGTTDSSPTAMVDISGSDDSNPAQNFTIVATVMPTVNLVVFPKSTDDSYLAGGTCPITWTYGGPAANVKIEYWEGAVPARQFEIDPATTKPNNGFYEWSIPSTITITEKAKIRVSISDDTSPQFSDYFVIKQGIIFTDAANNKFNGMPYPPQQTFWAGDPDQLIQWNITGKNPDGTDGAEVKIEYLKNDVVVIPPLGEALTGVTGFLWDLPSKVGPDWENVKVKISHKNISPVSKLFTSVKSVQGFKITGNVSAINAPASGAKWLVQEIRDIIWSQSGSFKVRVQHSKDNFDTYINDLTDQNGNAGANNFPWTIPNSTDYYGSGKIRVIALDDTNNLYNAISYTMPATFKILGKLQVDSPSGGTYDVDQNIVVNWSIISGSVAAIPVVDLHYSVNDGSEYPVTQTIASTTDNDGVMPWSIPDKIGQFVRVRVRDTAFPADVLAESGSAFKIKGAISQVVSPTLASEVTVGSPLTITWKSVGTFPDVKLQYSQNDGADWTDITSINNPSGFSGTASAVWNIPDGALIDSSKCYVRATTVGIDWQNLVMTSSKFTVKGTVSVSTPNSSSKFIVDQTNQTISGTKSAGIDKIKLFWRKDGGGWNEITELTGLEGFTEWSYNTWTIPDAISDNVQVRALDTTDAGIANPSEYITTPGFKIKGEISSVGKPGSGDTLRVSDGDDMTTGDAETITWTKKGSIASYKIEISTNGTG